MRVLLVSANEMDKAFFQGAARLAGFDVVVLPDPVQACAEIAREPGAVVVVDASTHDLYQAFERAVGDKIGLFSDLLNANSLIYVATCAFYDAAYLVGSEIFGHFVHRTFSEADQPLIGRVIAAAAAERAFGLEGFCAPGSKIQVLNVTKSLQKKVLVESLKNHLVKIGFKPRIAAVISTAIDELLMNAIFDAPVDELGRRLHAQTPRNAAFDLVGKNVVELKVVFDGQLLGICVTDLHGSLDKKKLLGQHLGKSYEGSVYEAKMTTAGAGIGLAQVYRNCGGMVFACEAGGRTEVSLFYRRTSSFKEFKDQFRFLSTYMYFS